MAKANGARSAAILLNAKTLKRAVSLASLGAAIALPVSAVSAQSDRQAQSVAERNAPEFSSEPVPVGGFQMFPSVNLDVEYNDNIFATNSNERDDAIISLRPDILLVDRRADRETRINGFANIRRFVDTTSENAERFGLNASTRHGIGTGFEYNLGLRAERSFEQRRDIDSFDIATAEAISFTNLVANAGVAKEFGPLKLSAEGRVRAVRFQGDIDVGGTIFDLSFRDLETYRGTVRASFARSRDQRFYVQGSVDKRDTQLAPLFEEFVVVDFVDRSSDGYRLEVGYGQQVTELLYLDVRAGYLQQSFDDPALNTIDGLSFEADVLWNVTPLTSVLLSAQRRVDETLNPRFTGLLRTEGRVAVEHELLRNLVLTGRIGYADLNLGNSDQDGRRWNVGFLADYRLDRNWSFLIEAEYFDRTGLNVFTQNSVSASLRYSF
ncbi:MAG: outer membrane beta-barrel protein [Pseudomonadota bacterium]